MNPRQFLDAIVRPNVAEFVAAYDDPRAAFNAVASVDALAGAMWVAEGKPGLAQRQDDTHYRDHLAARDPSFRLVRDVAKAWKHGELVRLSKDMKKQPEVREAQAMSTKQLGFGQGRYGEGRWGSPPQVVAETTTGEYRVIESVVVRALAFLEAEMVNRGM